MIAAEKIGEIRSINGCVLEVAGLDGGAVGERVILPEQKIGVILLLTREGAAVACLDPPRGLEVGARVEGAGEGLQIPVGRALIGEAIDPLGRSITTGTAVPTEESRPLRIAPVSLGAHLATSSDCQVIDTGVLAIDTIAPLGRGGRAVILGEQPGPRTRLAREIVRRQRGSGLRVVYVHVGEPSAELLAELSSEEARASLTLVQGGGASLALSCLAPLAGLVIADAARAQGEDVLLVIDSLSRHQRERDLLQAMATPADFPGAPPGPFVGWDAAVGTLLGSIWARSPAAGGGSITGLLLTGRSPSLRIDGIDSLRGWLYDPIVVLRETTPPGAREAGAMIDASRLVPGLPWGKLPAPRRRLRMSVGVDLRRHEGVLVSMARLPPPWAARLDGDTSMIVHRGERLRDLVALTTWTPLSVLEQKLLCLLVLRGHADRVAPADFEATLTRVLERAREPGEGILDQVAAWTAPYDQIPQIDAWFAQHLPAPRAPRPPASPLVPHLEVTEGGRALVSRDLASGEHLTIGSDAACTVPIAPFPERRRLLLSCGSEGVTLRLPDGWDATVTSPGRPPLTAADLRSPQQGLRHGDTWVLLPGPHATIELVHGRLRVLVRYQDSSPQSASAHASPPAHARASSPASAHASSPASAHAPSPARAPEPPRHTGSVILVVLKELFQQLVDALRGR